MTEPNPFPLPPEFMPVDLRTELRTALTRITTLELALEPFADIAEMFALDHDDGTRAAELVPIEAHWLTDAAAALTEDTTPHDR